MPLSVRTPLFAEMLANVESSPSALLGLVHAAPLALAKSSVVRPTILLWVRHEASRTTARLLARAQRLKIAQDGCVSRVRLLVSELPRVRQQVVQAIRRVVQLVPATNHDAELKGITDDLFPVARWDHTVVNVHCAAHDVLDGVAVVRYPIRVDVQRTADRWQQINVEHRRRQRSAAVEPRTVEDPRHTDGRFFERTP